MPVSLLGTVCAGLLVPMQHLTHLSQQASPQQMEAHMQQADGASLFPSSFARSTPSLLLAKEDIGTEEEKAAARQTGLLILLLSAAPSVWAQNELVWKKEKKDHTKKRDR